MQVRDGRRRRVRWEDEELMNSQGHGYKAERSDDAHTQSRCTTKWVGGRAMLGARGVEARSATATLNLYLSDALRERKSDPKGAVKVNLDAVGTGNDGESRATTTVERPESPLSRFLRKRQSMAPATKPKPSSATLCMDTIGKKLPKSSGYLERLLRAKIEEAKCLHGVRTTLQVSQSGLVRDRNTTTRSEEEHEAVEFPVAPVPHEKPKTPLLDLGGILQFTSASPDNFFYANDYKNQEQHSTVNHLVFATRAACTIQRMWRHYHCKSVQTQAKSGLQAREDGTKESEARVALISRVEEHSGECDRANSQDQRVDSDEENYTQVSEQASESTMNPGMWLDDEWTYLEEGRGTITELLDSPAHTEDASLETLVWKKPHAVVEMMDVMERQRVQRHKALKRKFLKGNRATRRESVVTTRIHENTTPIAVTHSPKRRSMVSITLPKSSKRRITRHSKMFRTQINTPRVELQPRRSEEDFLVTTMSSVQEDSDGLHEKTRYPEEQDIETKLMSDLHRYVVFPDPPKASSSDAVDNGKQRNDLIQVDNVWNVICPEEEEPVGHGTSESSSIVAPILGNLNARDATAQTLPPPANPETTCEEMDRVSAISTLSDVPVLEASSTDPSSSGDSQEQTRTSLSRVPPRLSPLRDVEIEAKRTLQRIQTQCTLDQQKLIDAYADDAYFSTFFGSSPGPRRLSPVRPLNAAIPSTPQPLHSKQLEFLSALADFKQSICISRAASTPHASVDQPTDQEQDDGEGEDGDVDVDAELQAMLLEIQRCKSQIALARAS